MLNKLGTVAGMLLYVAVVTVAATFNNVTQHRKCINAFLHLADGYIDEKNYMYICL